MASTRRFQIFQDPSASDIAPMQPPPTYSYGPAIYCDAAPLPNLSATQNIIFNPPSNGASGRSPLKTIRQPSTSPPKANTLHKQYVSLPPPQEPTFKTDSPTKNASIPAHAPILPHKPLQAIFTTFASNALADKENATPSYHSDNFAGFPEPAYGYKAPLKRTLSMAENSKDQDPGSKKARFDQSSAPQLPKSQNMPLLVDDGKKPPYSYAELIAYAILRSPDRRLTLAQIYTWISESFCYYRASNSGWQNSIRHNLSLNKNLIKQERPKDDPGKGNYWAIKPGCESLLIKEKATRRPTSSSGASMKSSSQQLSSESHIAPKQLPPAPKAHAPATEAVEPSSDATILASDAPSSLDDEAEQINTMPPPVSRLPPSSPLQAIHSSPPVAPHSQQRDDTPSPAIDFGPQPSSSPGSRKRKLAEMDDSGYFSSLNSSVTRPYTHPGLPHYDPDRSRIKRGRAEEEIVRIRSSSHDLSPSKSHYLMKRSTPYLVSSSPVRHFDTALMLPPLTPAFKLEAPKNPPASVSPNTNLRNHRNKIRELVGSPLRNSSLLGEEVSFSPAFNIVDDEEYLYGDDFATGFNVFTDNNERDYRRPSTSPLKRSARRVRTDRASKTSNILADVTGTSLNKATPYVLQPLAFESPLKQKSSKSPLRFGSDIEDLPKEDLFSFDIFDDDEPDDFGGLDILQGFQKIGGTKPGAAPTKKTSRPSLGSRSHTSRF